MRFLADAGISPKTVDFLRQRGHDAAHVRELLLQRVADRELIGKARAQARILLTFDLDFGEILALGILEQYKVIDLVLDAARGWGAPITCLGVWRWRRLGREPISPRVPSKGQAQRRGRRGR